MRIKEEESGGESQKRTKKERLRTPYRYVTVLSNHQRRLFERQSFPGKLSAAQARVLHYLLVFGRGAASRQEIEEEFGMRPPSATELLKTMEKNGLILVTTSEKDARKKKIQATARAKAYLESLRKNLNTLEAQMTTGLTPEELAVWNSVNEKMIANMKAAEDREKETDREENGAERGENVNAEKR